MEVLIFPVQKDKQQRLYVRGGRRFDLFLYSLSIGSLTLFATKSRGKRRHSTKQLLPSFAFVVNPFPRPKTFLTRRRRRRRSEPKWPWRPSHSSSLITNPISTLLPSHHHHDDDSDLLLLFPFPCRLLLLFDSTWDSAPSIGGGGPSSSPLPPLFPTMRSR